MSCTYVDLDDFCENNNNLDLLWRLYLSLDSFKVNLFTIPGRCSLAFLRYIQTLPWVSMIPHGEYHMTSRECEHWSYTRSLDYLEGLEKQAEQEGIDWVHGFKAPGWQISDGMYRALLEKGWWVADQAYNNDRRPPGLRCYLLDRPSRIHGHIGHWGGFNSNALELIFDHVAALRGQFQFIKDICA